VTQTNTEIYRRVFGCSPDSEMKTIKDIERVRKEASLEEYESLRDGIEGLVVDYPLGFMKDEDLRKKERHELGLYILPDHFFT
jgi:hypothetical protein